MFYFIGTFLYCMKLLILVSRYICITILILFLFPFHFSFFSPFKILIPVFITIIIFEFMFMTCNMYIHCIWYVYMTHLKYILLPLPLGVLNSFPFAKDLSCFLLSVFYFTLCLYFAFLK